jgi:hypothetical protein
MSCQNYYDEFYNDLNQFLIDIRKVCSYTESLTVDVFITGLSWSRDPALNAFYEWLVESKQKIKDRDENVMIIDNNSVVAYMLRTIKAMWDRHNDDVKTSIWAWLDHFIIHLKI